MKGYSIHPSVSVVISYETMEYLFNVYMLFHSQQCAACLCTELLRLCRSTTESENISNGGFLREYVLLLFGFMFDSNTFLFFLIVQLHSGVISYFISNTL